MSWLLFVAAAVLGFLTAWVVVPGWTPLLMNLSVGAPEFSWWLLISSVAVCALSVLLTASSRLSRLTLLVGAVSAVVASTPLVRAQGAIQQFDVEMNRALGANYLRGLPASITDRMRPRPLDFADLIRGVDFGEATGARMTFAAPDNQPLTMTVYGSKGSGSSPIVVQIYGSAWQGGASSDYPEFARYLATRGYLVFAIDYRHAPQWTWPAQLADVRLALGWIRDHSAEYGADYGSRRSRLWKTRSIRTELRS